ncbi:MAG: hypothetical protein EXX96DRAFT_622265 [Benjaminiella poitrasii]|nr:MAG: hypothetical protein EXX96DRAFT_622265 [Benjaminiella poitrasii]
MSSIAELSPNEYQIEMPIKVIELLVVLESKHEKSNSTITLYDYLVADDSGCIVLNTKQELTLDSAYILKHGHTEMIEGHLRLASDNLEPTTSHTINANATNNRSWMVHVAQPRHSP